MKIKLNLRRTALVAPICVALAGCAVPVTNETSLVESGFQNILDQQWNDAESYLLEALAENDDNPYALLNHGVVYQQTGREAEAREMYNRLIETNSTAVATRSNISADRGQKLTELAERNLQQMAETESGFGY
jgi:tetratricopeptide (TPR) repeat protein